MGALTDTRKRRFVDHHRLPFSPHPLSDSSLSSPPPLSKKPKLSSPPPAPQRVPEAPPPPPDAARPPTLRRFPPVAPLSRPVHGPQRILRAFGLGAAGSVQPRSLDLVLGREPDIEMGGLVSRYLQAKKAASLSSSRQRREKGEVSFGHGRVQGLEDDGSHEGLGLEQYKKLVSSVKEGHPVVSDSRLAEELVKLGSRQSPPAVSDLTAVVQRAEELSDSPAMNRKVEDASVVELESTPAREEKVWVKKSPLYKELYEDSVRKHDSKLSSLEFEVKLAEKKISSFRLAHEALKKKPKEDLDEPFVPLTDEEEEDVYLALHGRNSREVLVIHEPSNIEITREILQCLSCGAWLNDEVINLYLELLKERERREPKKFLKCHFFNTFFFKKIFVPIHKEIHWCLAIINVKDKKFQYLDSLGGMDMTVLRVLARYFMDEVKDKSGKELSTQSWKQEAVDNLPLQKNGWDCGMFMLKYADFYSRGLDLCFGQEHMAYFRKRTAKEILRLRAE
ncbi:ubiquitin-like-specific protease ESD4 isoform X2 [Phoenix dactylifera]|uniref:Ubiquitin-like-specific protease ESD4 isoform X2 n=1 Tax=Phoenix dactylifera TaxID=42345 RepID=A0A8B8IYB5_PHODC|nr:ubiquitin-like-specific protease ESD4 isoform X2 [Phoenix dactylifera]